MSVKSKIKSFSLKLIKSIVYVSLVAAIAIEAPFAHRNYIRGIAEDNSVKITSENGSGTGFHIQTKTGKVYILTNKHVCNMGGSLKVHKFGDKKGVERKIIKKYEKHDLCVMEALPGVSGIKIANKPSIGDQTFTLGHPRSQNLSVVTGEFFDEKSIELGEEVNANGTCDEGTLTEIPSFFGIFKICVVSRSAYQLSNITYPGNSGSAVVNKFGNLIGVIFAGSRDVENQGFAVSIDVVNDFLESL